MRFWIRKQWHQLDHMQTICTNLLQTDNHTKTLLLNFSQAEAVRIVLFQIITSSIV